MRRLWVRLSIAFGVVTLVGVLMVLLPAWIVSQDGSLRDYLSRRYLETSGLIERLQSSYRQHGGWADVERLLSAEDVVLPGTPGSSDYGLIFADASGLILFDARSNIAGTYLEPEALASGLVVMLDGQPRGYLLLRRLQTGSYTGGLPQDFQSVVIREVLRILIIVLSAGGLVSILVGIGASHWLTRPLAELARTTRAFGPHNLSVRAPVRGSTEVAAVAQAFNETADALERAEILRRKLVTDIAHEFRTPLTVLEANLQAMLDGIYPLNRNEIERLQEQTSLLHRLIDDLRELVLAESGQLRLALDQVDVNTLVRSQVDHFSAIAEAQGITLRNISPAIPLKVVADRSRLMQVCNNLLHNALVHTPAQGCITVSTWRAADDACIEVRDTGAGIPAEQLGYIFERFYRVDDSRSRTTGGAGLGLAIVKVLVEMHNGSVSVSSTGKHGEGTAFLVRLPLVMQAAGEPLQPALNGA